MRLANSSEKYIAKSTYGAMFSSRSVSQPTNIFSVVWNLKVPKKVQYFVWRLVMDRLPTKLNLRRRNIQLHEMQYQCPWCNDEEESSSMCSLHLGQQLPFGIQFIVGLISQLLYLNLWLHTFCNIKQGFWRNQRGIGCMWYGVQLCEVYRRDVMQQF